MQQDIERVLITEREIREKIRELGAQISEDFRGKDLVVVGILKGAALFCSDLFRAITIPAELDFMRIASYGAATKSTGVHRVLLDLDYTLEGRHVLIVEDIVDTGLTIKFLKEYLSQRGPAIAEGGGPAGQAFPAQGRRDHRLPRLRGAGLLRGRHGAGLRREVPEPPGYLRSEA